jgi:hypothetical protein
MIRNHTKITYNNTRLKTVYNLMLGLDYVINRNLLFQYKYKLYTRYLTDLITGNITTQKKQDLYNMLQVLVSSLTPPEYDFIFELNPPPPTVIPDIIVDSTYTFYVIQRKMPDRKYFIFKNLTTNFLLEPLRFYTFDVSDPSNLNTKLSFSEEKYTGIPYRGVEYVSTPGTEGAKVILTIYRDVSAFRFYVYNEIENFPVLQYGWGYSIESITVHLDNSVVESLINYLYVNSRQYSYLSIYESSGPKFSINDNILSTVFIQINQYHYSFTYGTYYLDIPKTYASTLLNKGYEDSISFIGDSDKKSVDTIYGNSIASKNLTTLQEGTYDFYYGRVQMTIYKPFTVELSFYSRSFGFMGGMNLLNFVNIMDIPDPVKSLPYYNTLEQGDFILFNGDTDLKQKYGLSMGIYILNIKPPMEVAFLDWDKNELFEILTTPDTITSGPFKAPDGHIYTFYSGRINIAVKGWFDFISMCTRSGYSGGYKLLFYNSFYGPPSVYTYRSKQSIKGLCSQNNINIYENKFIYFNDDYISSSGYGLYNGVYTIYNIPSNCPITLLNKNKETLVRLESLSNDIRKGPGPDGTTYTFYYGTLRISVYGNFGRMSLYTLFKGYMGRSGLFEYDPVYNNDISYPDARSIPIITPVPPNTSFIDIPFLNTYIPLRILMDGNRPLDVSTSYSDLYTYPVIYNVVNITTTISFNSEQPNTNKKFSMKNGIYVIDSSSYITVLNSGNDNIKIVGILSQKSLSSDGNQYTYFRGNTIAIYVYGNFGWCSLEVLGGPVGNYMLLHEDNIIV